LGAQIQFNVEYVPLEDRLRLRIRKDEAEYMVWLTRRYTKLLLGVLDKVSGTEYATDGSVSAKQAAKSFQRDAALEGADFKTKYQETASEHPLGDVPVLLQKITYTTAENGMVKFSLSPHEGKGININLSQDVVFLLLQLLQQAVEKAEWGFVVTDTSSAVTVEGLGTNRLIH
jgi:hypothetical protein